MSALIARLAPWSMMALVMAGVVIWGLWGRLEAAETKLAAANTIIEQHEKDAKANARSVAQLGFSFGDDRSLAITDAEFRHECERGPANPR